MLGVSFGGAVAQQLTVAHQHRIRRLVLASTTCGIGGVPGNPLALSLLATPLRYYSPTFMRLTANILYGPRAERGRRAPRPPDRRPPGPATDAVGLRRTARRDRRLVEPPVAAPHPTSPPSCSPGSADAIVPPVNARILARRIPNAELDIVPDAGHLLLMDHADRAASPHRRLPRPRGPCRPRTSEAANLVVPRPKPTRPPNRRFNP